MRNDIQTSFAEESNESVSHPPRTCPLSKAGTGTGDVANPRFALFLNLLPGDEAVVTAVYAEGGGTGIECEPCGGIENNIDHTFIVEAGSTEGDGAVETD